VNIFVTFVTKVFVMHFKIVQDCKLNYALKRFASLIKFVCTKLDLDICINSYLLNMYTLHGYN
jgi:hypothetical protein